MKNIFEPGELKEDVVVSKMEIPTPHGAIANKTQNSPTKFYNLDAIISVGYRANFIRAINFCIWATSILMGYMIKGFAMDDERLKQGKTAFGKDYFKELLERAVTGHFDYIEDLIEREYIYNGRVCFKCK